MEKLFLKTQQSKVKFDPILAFSINSIATSVSMFPGCDNHLSPYTSRVHPLMIILNRGITLPILTLCPRLSHSIIIFYTSIYHSQPLILLRQSRSKPKPHSHIKLPEISLCNRSFHLKNKTKDVWK